VRSHHPSRPPSACVPCHSAGPVPLGRGFDTG
jgi:hypothetical protein